MAGQRGKAPVFSDEENEVLRAVLREVQASTGLSGAGIGRLIGVKQQTASKLLGWERAGMGRSTANALASHLKYRDAEELLLERHVLAAMKEIPTGKAWGNRDTAVRIAQKLEPPYEREAIDAIVARYTSGTDRTKPVKWWLTKFGEEEKEIASQRPREISPAPASGAQLPATTSKKKRGSRSHA